jgi:hypothetical protein
MEELDYRAKAVDQFAMFFSISLELVCSVLKQLKDSIGRITILKLVGERTFCEVYPCPLDIVGQSFDDQLKVRRGHGTRRQRWRSAQLLREDDRECGR